VLKRQFDVQEPNKVWVIDITYIRTYEGWLYLIQVAERQVNSKAKFLPGE